MRGADFLDSNILLYDLWDKDPRKQSIAGNLIRRALEEKSSIISFQVIQECLAVVSRKSQPAWDLDQTRDYLESVLAPLCRVYASIPLYQDAVALQLRWRFSFYDSLIVASALSAGCETLYTEDLQHGQEIEGLTVVNPFI